LLILTNVLFIGEFLANCNAKLIGEFHAGCNPKFKGCIDLVTHIRIDRHSAKFITIAYITNLKFIVESNLIRTNVKSR
jgi:hypothetical protein